MGSRPWIAQCRRRLLNSEQYREGEPFEIRRRSIVARGPIEVGTSSGGVPVIFVGETAEVRLDRETLIDGTPAPDWPPS